MKRAMAGLTALLAVAALVWTTAEAKKGVAKNTKVEEVGRESIHSVLRSSATKKTHRSVLRPAERLEC